MIGEMRVEVAAGPGVVGRWPGLVLVAGADGDPAALAELVDLAAEAAAAGDTNREVSHRLARYMTARPPEELPSFCVLVDAEDAVAVVLRGAATLTASAGGTDVELNGADRPTWVDDYLPGDLERVVVGAGATVRPAPVPGDLRAGVVPGAGAVLVAAGGSPPVDLAAEAPGQEPTPEEPAVEEAAVEAVTEEPPGEAAPVEQPPAAAFEAIDLSAPPEDAAPREPLPVAEHTTGSEPPVTVERGVVMVTGVLSCDRQHFNHPEARYCAHCGKGLVVGHTLEATTRPRPPLGNLVFGDGRMLALDASYVIGRDPSRDDRVQDGSVRGFPLEDPDQVLSRVHVEVRLTDWDVELVDRGSANGTYVRATDGDQWQRLDPQEPYRLAPGCEAKVGSHSFTFDSHIRRG